MSLLSAIVFGSALLVLCNFAHLAVVFGGIHVLRRYKGSDLALILAVALLTTIVAHTVQIWAWAFSFQIFDAFETFENSFYFAISTYTTVGYGDVVLGPDLRVFAAFAAVTGMLSFGVSAAFLVGVITRVMPRSWRQDH